MNDMNDMTNDISQSFDNMIRAFKKFGVSDKTIDKILEGHEVAECGYCHTPNMYSIHTQSGKGGWVIYECGKCDKTHLELDYGKKDLK